MNNEMNIAELADRAGLSRRAVRYYVQEGLLPAPEGLGRGSHYTVEHLERLRQIAAYQRAGHSLEAIRRILGGEQVAPPPAPKGGLEPVAAELLARVQLMEGVELVFDAAKFHPNAMELHALKDAARRVFRTGK